MSIGFENVSRPIPPQPSGVGEVASRRLSEEDSSVSKRRDAASPADDFSMSPFAEFAKIAGEESVDERALRRDDDLGNLISRAFDPVSAAAVLPSLGIEVK